MVSKKMFFVLLCLPGFMQAAEADLKREDAKKQKELDLALHEAVERGSCAMVKALLDAKANVYAVDSHGETARYKAGAFGHSEILVQLFDAGIDQMAQVKLKKESATEQERLNCSLLKAAKVGNIVEVRNLLSKKANIEARDSRYDETALIKSAEGLKIDVVELLLANKANVNARGLTRKTALHQACIACGCLPVVKVLLQHKASVNTYDINNHTPLMLSYDSDVISCLLACNARVDARNDLGATALHQAVRFGSIKSVVKLLVAGADIRARTYGPHENVPADYAWRDKELRSILEDTNITKKEIEYLRKKEVAEEDIVALCQVVNQRKEAEKKKAVETSMISLCPTSDSTLRKR